LRSQDRGIEAVDALVEGQTGLSRSQRERLQGRRDALIARVAAPPPGDHHQAATNGASDTSVLSETSDSEEPMGAGADGAAPGDDDVEVLLVRPESSRNAVATVLHALVAKTLERVGADLCQIYIEEESALTMRAEAPAEGGAISGPRTLNRRTGIVAALGAAAGGAVEITDLSQLAGMETAWAERGVKRLAVVSVGNPGEDGSGILIAARYTNSGFTDLELRELDRLAVEVSQAMGSADLLSRAEELAVLKERMKLAREIHDGLASDLSAVVALFKYHEHRSKNDPAEGQRLLAQMRELVEGSLQSARDILATLRPRHQPEADLVEAVRRQVEDFANTYGITAVARIEGTSDEVGREERDAIYAILREALTNVRKHSQAGALEVRMDLRERPYTLDVEDDGLGIDLAALDDKFGSFGLVGMRERTELLGGSIEVGNGNMGGARILFRGPVEVTRRG
jgi:signal transduction histidine kinase